MVENGGDSVHQGDSDSSSQGGSRTIGRRPGSVTAGGAMQQFQDGGQVCLVHPVVTFRVSSVSPQTVGREPLGVSSVWLEEDDQFAHLTCTGSTPPPPAASHLVLQTFKGNEHYFDWLFGPTILVRPHTYEGISWPFRAWEGLVRLDFQVGLIFCDPL